MGWEVQVRRGNGAWARLRAVLRAHPTLSDTLLAVGLYCGLLALIRLAPPQTWPKAWDAALAWHVVGMAPVAIRRRWPWLAIIVMTAHTLASLVAFRDLGTQGVAIMVITYTAAAYLPLKRAILAWSLLWVPALTIGVFLSAPPDQGVPMPFFVAFNLVVALVGFFIGRTVYNRRAYVAALEDRAVAAELNRDALTTKAVADERRRIARELHDVVAHHVSVMGVLATGSRRMLHRDPSAVDEALATIEETGRSVLREMRRLLDVLRTDEEAVDELTPQPGLGAVTNLVEQVREAGLPVTLTVQGAPSSLDPGVALTIYRIVQEALTNTLKHAGTATAEVRLSFDVPGLVVEVCDTGRGPTPGLPGVGHGLLGMRERVTLYGGTLRTGPRPGGGFRVYAKIPVDALNGAAERGAGEHANW
jgi:signal transduction histidine kinase